MTDATFDEYRKEYLEDVRINAQIDGVTPDEYFFTDALDKLSAMGEITDPVIRPIQKRCRNNKIMTFDAYAFDASDKSFVLITNDFKDVADATLTRTDLDTIRTRMLNFIQEAFDEKLQEYFDLTDEMLLVGRNIARRMKKDYVDLDNDDSIDKIKLYIVTNKVLSDKITSLKCEDFLNKRVELNVWSIKRFYDLYQSGKDREPILIETDKYGVSGIPCIQAEMSGNLDYDAYLAIVPGEFLHKIYYDHGSRLLEGNVRAFLSNRGKINKGIRETIRKEPTKFFAYNNGIACTAAKITLSDDGRYITSIEDLQIINGGQTTASLTSAVTKDKLPLDNIFVPMKLTVVKNDDYDVMIQNISKYANSQNSVKNSDFFSNHPFHRVFEALSKKIPAPIFGDNVNNTFWYYERSRGKYDQEQFKIVRKSEKDAFARRYPKNQLIKKEDLAKYFTSAELLRPDIVSKGGEKCMSFFAEYIDEKYQKMPEYFNDEFFKMAICYAILFKTTDKIVKNSSWYISASYTKPFIIPYTIAKILAYLPKDYCLDYDLIWKKQMLYSSLSSQIEKVAHATNDFISASPGSAREYCSKEETWKKYKEIDLTLDAQFIADLISKDVINERIQGEIKEKKLEKDVNCMVEIYNLGNDYWKNLLNEGIKRRILSPMEIDLINLAIAFTENKKVPLDKQAKLIWKIRDKLDQAGVLI